MLIDVAKLNAGNGYGGTFSYDYDVPEYLSVVPLFTFAGPAKVSGRYFLLEDGSLDVYICVRFTLTGSCSYCLEHAEKEITYDYEAMFVTHDSDEDYPYDGKRADITPAVNDAILFSQPGVILCREGCEGIGNIEEE